MKAVREGIPVVCHTHALEPQAMRTTIVLAFLVLLLGPFARPATARPAAQDTQAAPKDGVLSIDGHVIGADEYGSWLLSIAGERFARTFAGEFWIIDREAKRLDVDTTPEVVASRVEDDIQVRIKNAFYGRRDEWLKEIARTRRTEGGVRRQRETEMKAWIQAENICNIDRVVPENKVVREWELQYGRNGLKFDLLMMKFQVIVPSELGVQHDKWKLARQRVMDEALAKSNKVRDRVLAGEDFGKLAREFSDDPDTRDHKGVPSEPFRHYGWPRNFLGALEQLKVGDVSEPLYGHGGYWLLKVRGIVATPLEKVRAAITADLALRGPEQDEVGAVMERLRNGLQVKILPAMYGPRPDGELPGAFDPVLEVDGDPVTRSDYARWLLHIQGETLVQRYVEDWAVIKKARELGVSVTEAEIRARTHDRVQFMVNEGYKGQREGWMAFLALNGRSEESFVREMTFRTRTDLLAEKLMMKERKITPEDVQLRYDNDYGKDGLRTEVRWMVRTFGLDKVDPAWTRDELTKNMRDVTDKATLEMAGRVARVRAGEDFAAIARKESDDEPTRESGGLLPDRFRRDQWSQEIADAVSKLQPGQVTDPLVYGNYVVAFQIASQKKVTFDAVKDELRHELEMERPDMVNVAGYRNSLTQKLDVQLLSGMGQ
jgi:parvulin-like peptidyl-prolyl isomerase